MLDLKRWFNRKHYLRLWNVGPPGLVFSVFARGDGGWVLGGLGTLLGTCIFLAPGARPPCPPEAFA